MSQEIERDPNDGPGDTPDHPDIWTDGPVAMPGDGQDVREDRIGDTIILDFDQPAADDSDVIDVGTDDAGPDDAGPDDAGPDGE